MTSVPGADDAIKREPRGQFPQLKGSPYPGNREGGSHKVYFNAAAFAMLGDESTQFEVSEVNQIDGALDKMVQFIEDPPQTFTANKATQKYIDITTPMGTETLYVPQNDDEVSLVKDSDEWMVADTKAIEVGLLSWLSFGKNRKEPASYVKEHNLTVYDAQMARRLKVENGKLAERDARKSRVAVNWVKHKRTNKHKMKFEPSPTYSTSADPFTKKMNIGIATSLKYTKLKADVSGAYRQVTTPRGERAIRCPKHLRTYDANGEEEYIVVDTAVEGEPYSGFEWDVKFLNDRLEIGWRIVPGVPGMMVYKACTMIGEVDYFMIMEPSKNKFKYSALTIHLLEQRLVAIEGAPAIKVDPEPEIYAGLEMATSMERDRCTLRVDQKIKEAARKHVPALVDKDKQGIKELELLKGVPLSKALESLKLEPLPAGVKAVDVKLTEEQKLMMQLAGDLRFPAEYMPALELPLCKLSRVVARAPEGSYKIGQSVIAAVYKEIESKKGIGITYQAGKDAPRLKVAMKGETRYIDDGKDVEYKGQSGVKLKDGAAARLETFADATWGKVNDIEPSYFNADGVLTQEAFEQIMRDHARASPRHLRHSCNCSRGSSRRQVQSLEDRNVVLDGC